MKRTVGIIFSLVFVATLCAVFVLTLLNMDKDFSFFENRTLTELPTAERNSVLDGSMFDEAEKSFTDHAPLRDLMLASDVRLKLDILHLPVVNDVVAADGELLHFYPFGFFDPNEPDSDGVSAAERAAAESAAAHAVGSEYIYVGVPSQLTYFSELYPDYLEHGAGYTDKLYTVYFGGLRDLGVDCIDMREVFSREGNDPGYYMQTDHHLSFDGAYLTYLQIVDMLNEKGIEADALLDGVDFVKTTLPNPFIGSRNRKLYGLFRNGDAAGYMNMENAPIISVQSDGGTYDSVYEFPDNDTEPVTYEFYMGGDHAETVVRGGADNGVRLLVCGSSYTNAVETFLAYSCEEMRSLDMRYYTAKSLEQYIADYRPDAVVMLFDDGEFVKRAGDN